MTNDVVIVGKVGAPYGVKGWSKINSFTIPVENIIDYQPWLIGEEGNWREIAIVPARAHSNAVIARLPNSLDRDAAMNYTHTLIAVSRQKLPPLASDEYYWNDLIGMKVVDIHGKTLGTVTNMMEAGAIDVLIVSGEKVFAVPMRIDDVVKKVDLDNKTISVDWDPEFE
jgi:16S rRNA processing protein RimM